MFGVRRIAMIVTGAVAVLMVGYGAAYAADPVPKIGVVDLDKVHNEAPRIKQYWEEINTLKASLEKKLEIRSQNMLLGGNEIEELVGLKTKAGTPTDQEKSRIKELESAQEARQNELQSLEQTKDPNAQQSARMKELQDARKTSSDAGEAITKDYDTQLKTKVTEMDGKAEADLREAVSKVAAAKGLGVVIAKDSVLLGGIDITDDVIGKLDRKSP